MVAHMLRTRRAAGALLLLSWTGSLACGERAATITTPAEPAHAGQAAAGSDRPGAPPTLRLGDDVRPTGYAVDLTIVPARTRFQGAVSIAAEVRRPVTIVWLNATELDIAQASLGGHPARVVPGNEDFIGLTTGSALPPGPLAIDVRYSGKIDHEKSRGIYAEREGDQWYAYTFFEPIDARRAFPCFDQPDAKVPWKLTFHIEQDQVALANAPVESEAPEAGGMKKVVIAESKPLPSYLVAFVVGAFEVVDGGAAGRAKTPIRFIIPRGRAAELRYARAVTPRVVAALEDYFDMDYPYGKLDVAVVPRYWGTMEHPGIVAMGQPLTLIQPQEETRQRRQAYANILAHELSHYWFGDLVTMAWWNDTWLNEALGQWMDAIITDKAEPGWKFPEAERPGRSADAMSTDEKLSTRAIRQPVTTRQGIESSFDGDITYEKGSTVLHMFETWVGEDRWRDFIRAYMRKHAWKNATAEDFLGAMGETLGREVAGAFRTFLEQPGAPLIEHRLVCEGAGSPHLELHQSRALPAGVSEKAARTWQVPVCVRYGTGARSRRACVLMTASDGALPLEGACPKWIVMNAGGTGYYRSAYTSDEIAPLMTRRSPARPTVVERQVLMADIAAAVGRDQLHMADAMAMVPALLADREERIQSAAGWVIDDLRPDQLDDASYELYRHWVVATYGPLARRLGWKRRPGDPDERQQLRAVVVSTAAMAGDEQLRAQADRLAVAWLADRKAVEDDMVDQVLAVAAHFGDASLWGRILAAARAEKDRRVQGRLLSALGGFRAPALTSRALELALTREFDFRESRAVLGRALRGRESRALAWTFIQQHIDALLGGMRSDEAGWFVGSMAVFCDPARRGEVKALLDGRVAKIDGARYRLDQALEAIDRCVATQSRIAPSAIEFLAHH